MMILNELLLFFQGGSTTSWLENPLWNPLFKPPFIGDLYLHQQIGRTSVFSMFWTTDNLNNRLDVTLLETKRDVENPVKYMMFLVKRWVFHI